VNIELPKEIACSYSSIYVCGTVCLSRMLKTVTVLTRSTPATIFTRPPSEYTALDNPRRALGRAFREQEDDQAAHLNLVCALREQRITQASIRVFSIRQLSRRSYQRTSDSPGAAGPPVPPGEDRCDQ